MLGIYTMNNLRKIRKMNNLTQSELGKIFGVAQGTISYYESIKNLSNQEFLKQYTKFFKYTSEEIISGDFLIDIKNKIKYDFFYSDYPYLPIKIIKYFNNTFIMERQIDNETVVYYLEYLSKNRECFKLTFDPQYLSAFLGILYDVLSNEFTIHIENDDFEVYRFIESNNSLCSLCKADSNLLLIKLWNYSIILCETCAEKIYYCLDDLSYNYIEKKRY